MSVIKVSVHCTEAYGEGINIVRLSLLRFPGNSQPLKELVQTYTVLSFV